MAEKKTPTKRPAAAAAPPTFDPARVLAEFTARPLQRGQVPPLQNWHRMIVDTLDSPDASLGAVKVDIEPKMNGEQIVADTRSLLRRHGHKFALRSFVAKDHILFWAVTPKPRQRKDSAAA